MLQVTAESAPLLALPEKSSVTIKKEYLAAKAESVGLVAEYLFSTNNSDKDTLLQEMKKRLVGDASLDPDLNEIVSEIASGVVSLKAEFDKLTYAPQETLSKLLAREMNGTFSDPIKVEFTPLAVVCYLSEADYHKRSETSVGLSLRQSSLGDLAGRLILINLGTTKDRSDGKERPPENIERTRMHELLHALSYKFNAPVDFTLFLERLGGEGDKDLASPIRDGLLFKTWTESLAYYGSGLTHVDVPSDEFFSKHIERVGNARADIYARTQHDEEYPFEVLQHLEEVVEDAIPSVVEYDTLARSACKRTREAREIWKAIGAILTSRPQDTDLLMLALGLHPHTERERAKHGAQELQVALEENLRTTLEHYGQKDWFTNDWRTLGRSIDRHLHEPQSREWYPSEEITLRPLRMLIRYADTPELINVAARAIERLTPLVTDHRELSITAGALKRLDERLKIHSLAPSRALMRVEERLRLLRTYDLVNEIDRAEDPGVKGALLRIFVESIPRHDTTLWTRSFFPRHLTTEMYQQRDMASLLMCISKSPCCIRAYDAALALSKLVREVEISEEELGDLIRTTDLAIAFFEAPTSRLLQRQNREECFRVLRELKDLADQQMNAQG